MGMIAPQPSPTTAAARVLVVDDEPQLVRGLTIVLRTTGYMVESARTAPEALAVVAGHRPDALLLDLELPGGEGIQVCYEVRRFSQVPILLMSATGGGREKLRALEAGADDYLPKPFGEAEVLGRRNRMLAASARIAGESRLEIRELAIDLVRRRVTRAGAVLLLEATEFELVRVLAERRGRIVTDRERLRAVWGDQHGQETHRLRVAIARLRVKLERDSSRVEALADSQRDVIASAGKAALVLGALGVVYGDIGTSPLYTEQVIFSSYHATAHITPANVYGVASLIFWSHQPSGWSDKSVVSLSSS